MGEYTYHELADQMFESAVDLYMRGDFAVSIVTASAAEHTYAAIFLARFPDVERDAAKQKLAHAEDRELIMSISKVLPGLKLTDKQASDLISRSRNRLIHGPEAGEDKIELDLEDEAFEGIERATDNRGLIDKVPHRRWTEMYERHREFEKERRHVLD